MSDFTNNPEILKILKEVAEIKKSNKQFSDIIDDEGNQYVDLVQEGGGVLGIALVGYTFVLEKLGIRFFSLAGTSAGAINTVLMAALDNIEQEKSVKILEELSNQNLFDFVDGNQSVKRVINILVKKGNGLIFAVMLASVRIYSNLKEKLGLNPGKTFENWLSTVLAKYNINNIEDLIVLRNKFPNGFKSRNLNEDLSDLSPKLAIIASDISTSTKAEFPRMNGLYWKDPNEVPIAMMVRASMSIPIFFEPVVVKDIPKNGSLNDKDWFDFARYSGPIPKEVRFVDGGILSNFPINVFHRSDGGIPRMPTFGARLSVYRENFRTTNRFLPLCTAMFNTMRQIHDYDFLLKNPDYSELICRIDADDKYDWLDFKMSQEDQIGLFNLGASKALEFVKKFNWSEYKKIREKLSIV